MNRPATRSTLVALAIGATLVSRIAEAQWVLLARRAIGRVEQMSQQQPNGGAAYVSAAVMVEVPIETAVARPVLALIVATPPAEEVHVAVLVRFWVLLSV